MITQLKKCKKNPGPDLKFFLVRYLFKYGLFSHFMVILAILEPFLTSEVAAIFEHIPGLRVEGPKRAFSRFIRRPGNFDKTVVETQRMPNGILPALLILTVKWK